MPIFPVRSPRSGDMLQAPLLPSAQAYPKKKSVERQGSDKRNYKGKRSGPLLCLSRRRHEVRRGQEMWWFVPTQLLRLRPQLLQPLPHLQLRHRADGVTLLPRHPPAHIRGHEEVQHRPAAPPIGQEVPHLPPVLPPPGLLLHIRRRIFCCGFHSGHSLKRWSRVCVRYRHHQPDSSGSGAPAVTSWGL